MSNEKKFVDIKKIKKEKKRRQEKIKREQLKKALWMRKSSPVMISRIRLLFKTVIVVFIAVLFCVTYINVKEGKQYSKKVLSQSQQRYGSTEIPFKRGDIRDRNNTVLATSEKVYKVILDCKVVNSRESYREPTVQAMSELLGIDQKAVLDKLDDPKLKKNQYQVMKTEVPLSVVKQFEEYKSYPEIQEKTELTDAEKEEKRRRNNIKGVWFEEQYRRVYPLNEVASHLVGFTNMGNKDHWGLEGYYSNTLDGINGRKYGYYNEDAYVEQNLIEPVNGNNIITTIDINIQKTVEKYIQNFVDGMEDKKTGTRAAENIGVIVMDPNNGQILAMASENPFDLNNPRDIESYYTAEEIAEAEKEDPMKPYTNLWMNYCISESFEPGSTVKPLTIAGALQDGSITKDMEFTCDGFEAYGETKIRCAVYPGAHGVQTLSEVMKNSCNDALMEVGRLMGPEEFLKYQHIFNFGSKTGIDLPGESAGLLHDLNTLSSGQGTELASASFGQGYNCTMIQEISAIASVINGGYYYRPYVVSKVVDEQENVVEYIDPVVQKQTVSSEVSALIREYMGAVCEPGGSGYAAKIDGYSMGGKTGTAQKYPREDNKYLVSYIGFAPLDNPQVLIYVVVDEPNAENQSDSRYAQYIAKGVMEEILPYLNIFPDEEKTGQTSSHMIELESMIENQAAVNREGADDPNLPLPPENNEKLDLHNTREDQGITNEEAGLEGEE